MQKLVTPPVQRCTDFLNLHPPKHIPTPTPYISPPLRSSLLVALTNLIIGHIASLHPRSERLHALPPTPIVILPRCRRPFVVTVATRRHPADLHPVSSIHVARRVGGGTSATATGRLPFPFFPFSAPAPPLTKCSLTIKVLGTRIGLQRSKFNISDAVALAIASVCVLGALVLLPWFGSWIEFTELCKRKEEKNA